MAYDETGQPLSIADSTGAPLENMLGLKSTVAVMVEKEKQQAFFNYPNPFGRPDRPVTNFVYYLDAESDVEIHIYTLTGDLVKTWSFTKAEHPDYTSPGVHQAQITWDGKNGMDEDVVNGVYIAYIKTEDGTTALTKIAVVR